MLNDELGLRLSTSAERRALLAGKTKNELIKICRQLGISAGGSAVALKNRLVYANISNSPVPVIPGKAS